MHVLGMDPVEIVKATLHAGDTPGQIAHVLIEDHHLAPIPAIKALRDGGDMTLGEAKEIVHRSLPMDQHSAAEQLSEGADRLRRTDGGRQSVGTSPGRSGMSGVVSCRSCPGGSVRTHRSGNATTTDPAKGAVPVDSALAP
jgi:hypothetical protein